MSRFLQNTLTTAICLMALTSLVFAQCPSNVLTNGGFEEGASVDWWSWHDNSPDAYAFGSSDESFEGDSSALIQVLVPTDEIPGGQGGEFNSRPQTNSVIGGEFYEISLVGKSTRENTNIIIYIKDENDGWILLHNETLTVGTDWTRVTSIYQADKDREDIHLEIKVYNAGFDGPYDVWIDDVAICATQITTLTCEDNVVSNPGFEEGAFTDWWNWHGGDETDYTFEDGTEGYLGSSSAVIRVNKPSSELTGAGQYNSRPQTSPLVAEQNYKVTLYGKSTLENTVIQAWVKDEFDGWTTVGNADLTVGTDWTEGSFVFTADADREDVHLELVLINVDFTEPYTVWIDEVSICTTDEEPGTGEPEPERVPVFGSNTLTATCSNNLAPGNDGFEDPGLGEGWDIWDGSDDEELSTFNLDAVLPYSGANSMRIDVVEGHNVAEFHHRFGNRMELLDGVEYTISMWIRSNLSAGDTVRVFTRPVRDTDWTAQTDVDFLVTSDEWLNFHHTFTADGTWDNAFLEMKAQRWNDFSAAYSLWYDDIQICESENAVVGIDESLESLGLSFNLYPNPVSGSEYATLNIVSQKFLSNASFQLIDLTGRTVWEEQRDISSNAQNVLVPTAGLATGMYIVNINHNGFTQNLRLTVAE